jgi:hypothetical protein
VLRIAFKTREVNKKIFKMSLNLDELIESEEELNPVEDGDTIKNINEHFPHQFTQVHQESASLKKKYITHAANAGDSFSKIAIGLGNEMQIYDVTASGLSKYVGKNEFGQFDHPISGITFFKDDMNMVLTSTIAGEIHLYDLRSFSKVHTFEGKLKIFSLLYPKLTFKTTFRRF